MAVNREHYKSVLDELTAKGATLVAVSKTKPVEDIQALYDLGQRDFGENYVQELIAKQPLLPSDIRWHFIGHLQRNKVKYIVPFCSLIQGVDSIALLQEINKQAKKLDRKVDCLLQVHIAKEETKFGMDEAEVMEAIALSKELSHVRIKGLMGMASLSVDLELIKAEFHGLHTIFNKTRELNPEVQVLSMGMSSDYHLALKKGSNMVRVGSLLFGARAPRIL